MTNKEFRDDLAKEMWKKRQERDEQLKQIEKSSYSNGLKEQMREEIMKNFYKEMYEMKTRPGYEEARMWKKRQERDEQLKQIEKSSYSNGLKEQMRKEIMKNFYKKMYEMKLTRPRYEEAQIHHRGKVEKSSDVRKLSQEKKEKLYGNKEVIIQDLKDHYVKIEESAEMMGYKGKKVRINLPAVGNFEGFKFDYFISDMAVTKSDFEHNSKLEKISYSRKDVIDLFRAINKYFKNLGIEIDRGMDYEKALLSYKYYKCDAGEFFKDITGLDCWCWLSDKDVEGRKGTRAGLDCGDDWDEESGGGSSSFDWQTYPSDEGYLFLELFDQVQVE